MIGALLLATLLRQDPAAKIRELVGRLEDDAPEVRAAASRELLRLGRPALPLLLQAAPGQRGEARLRVDEIIAEIQWPEAEAKLREFLKDVGEDPDRWEPYDHALLRKHLPGRRAYRKRWTSSMPEEYQRRHRFARVVLLERGGTVHDLGGPGESSYGIRCALTGFLAGTAEQILGLANACMILTALYCEDKALPTIKTGGFDRLAPGPFRYETGRPTRIQFMPGQGLGWVPSVEFDGEGRVSAVTN